MSFSNHRISMLWLFVAALAISILVIRFQVNFKLGVFFPDSSTLSHQILLEQLKNGPGSRLIVVGLKGASPERLAEFSDQLKSKLATNPRFASVLNGDFDVDSSIIPEPVNSYYMLMADIDFSSAALNLAIQSRERDLAFASGEMIMDLIAKDPFLQTLNILERLAPVNSSEGTWFANDGSAVLLVETKAIASDLDAQALAIDSIKMAFSNIAQDSGMDLELTGVGAFGLELQQTIKAEAKRRTILASAALMLVLLIFYRKPRLLLLVPLPLVMGFIVGLALVTLVFGSVHGITLAFGFTLMGIAIDYPLHLFSHSRGTTPNNAVIKIWPTLRIGAVSTAIAYLALVISGSQGLAQLGLFTATGVVVAALVTRTWLPAFMANQSQTPPPDQVNSPRAHLSFLPAIICVVLSILAIQSFREAAIWDDQLSSLSPVPTDRLLTDSLLRSAAATSDMRYQLVLHATTLETLLHQHETLDIHLQQAVNDGVLGDWQSANQILPSQSLQKLRLTAIPDPAQLASRLSEVVEKSVFRVSAFEPFLDNAQQVKQFTELTPEAFIDSPLESWLDSHLVHINSQWVSLISLSHPQPEELAARLDDWNVEVELIDLQKSSQTLVGEYRTGALKSIAFACLAIILLLLVEQRQPRRLAWLALTVIAALSVTTSIVAGLHGSLTIVHLVALLLVIGLGIDYALFLSRQE